MKFSTKIKGIFKVSSANIIGLFLSMLTSFVLPLFISVEEYGYWQLFVLYASYTGFFMFGFNDGVHLNYAAYDYDEVLAAKFHTFKSFLTILSIIESVLLISILLVVPMNHDTTFYLLFFCILGIYPQALFGLFIYMNQSTLRFTEYAIGNIFDKVIFAIFMITLLFFRVHNSLFYISAYIVSRYLLIGYFWYSSRLVFTAKPIPFSTLKNEIIKNFKDGLPLTVATVLHGSIIVGSRLLVQGKYGIESFSAYSFSIHTIVIAAQFIGAIATVFYPIMKRAESDKLQQMYNSFDRISTIVSAVLLLSYFIVVILIKLVYVKYVVILDYLFWVYPLFIFTCKANLLVTNYFKVKNQPFKLIVINGIAIVLHMAFAILAYFIFGSIESIACSVLLSYSLWYYLCQIYIYRYEGWKLNNSIFYDVLLVLCFEILIISFNRISPDLFLASLIEAISFVILCCMVYFIHPNKVNNSIREFSRLLN